MTESSLSWGSPLLTLPDALALGMDVESAKLIIRMQQEDIENVSNTTIVQTLPACEPHSQDNSSADRSQNCIVCLVENVSVRLGCGHAVLCTECAESIKNGESGITKCPLCRSFGCIIDSGPHLNLQASYLEVSKLTACDGCKVSVSQMNHPQNYVTFWIGCRERTCVYRGMFATNAQVYSFALTATMK